MCCSWSAVRAEVSIRVDGTQTRQTIEGFGATTMSLVYEGPLGDTLSPELRRRAIEAAYGQVKMNGGNLNVHFVRPVHNLAHGAEPAGLYHGYRTFGSEAMKTKLVDLAAPLGFTAWCLSPKIEIRWSNPQLRKLRQTDYPAFLTACGEQAALCARFWRDRYQLVPRFIMPFNEPTSGNGELAGGNAKEVAEIVRAIGQRLRAEGFADVQLVVPCEETVARSLAVAETILADEHARPFVGAIGYHCYPYGSPYASVPRILHASGTGQPDRKEIELRQRLRDLGRRYQVPLWMTEVSHSGAPALSFDALRGRAIHIHDEMLYADASAYYAMNAIWDLTSHRDHFKGRGGDHPDALFTEQDTVVLVDNDKRAVHITGMGYAIGHYARWVRRGAVRVEAESSDPLVQVTAFRDDADKRLVLVVINNGHGPQQLRLNANGFSPAGRITGEQSTAPTFWKPLPPVDIGQKGLVSLEVPGLSVTSLAVPGSIKP
jgi:O-glycosyl hydrolase